MPTRGTTTQQGYGWAHQQVRRRFLAAHHPHHLCCLCGNPLGPAGPHLHLDHCPTCKGAGCTACAGQGYRGLAHARCNTSDGATRGNRARRTLPTSRRW